MFPVVFYHTIQTITNQVYTNINDLLNAFHGMLFMQHKGIWKRISKVMNCTSTEIHDYFFNTWMQQFYKDPHPYKSELKQLFMEEKKKGESDTKCIENTIRVFQESHRQYQFYNRKLYQILYHFNKSKQFQNLRSERIASQTSQSDSLSLTLTQDVYSSDTGNDFDDYDIFCYLE